MSDLQPPDLPDDDTLAGEYVLGVLDQDERRTVRLRARTEVGLAAAIAAWERRLAPIAAGLTPVAPPAALWDRLEQAIAAAPAEPEPVTLRRSRAWPIATGLSLALAAGLAAFAVMRPAPEPAGFAALGPINAPAAFVAQLRDDGKVMLASLAPQDVPAGRDLELWVLPPGAGRVASLGVLPRTGTTVQLSSVPASGTQLLVSLEPAGGSPTGQPTGPVLYAGAIMRALR